MTPRNSITKIACAFWAIGLCAAFAMPAHANLVADPGFEAATGATTDPFWTFTAAPTFSDFNYNCGALAPHSGTHCAAFGAESGVQGDDDKIDQLLSTTAGDLYSISFWLASTSGHFTPDNDFTAMFGTDTLYTVTNLANQPFTLVTFNAAAVSASTDLQFLGRADPGFIGVDDVDVEDLGPAPVPEPASLALLGAGLIGLGRLRRRQNVKPYRP